MCPSPIRPGTLFWKYFLRICDRSHDFSPEFQQSHIDFSICILAMAFSMGSINVFIYCFLGKLATESFSKMADSLYDIDWHKLPVGVQKYVILMIGNMQQPLYYHGYFSITILNLDTFTVVKTCFFFSRKSLNKKKTPQWTMLLIACIRKCK